MQNHKSALVGKPAPDFDATTTDGAVVKASDFWREKPVVLVFLRHMGCTFCRTMVLDLAKSYAEFKALGAEVICVAMGPAAAGKAFKIMFEVPFPIIMTGEDNTRPYDLYGLGKGTFGQLLGIASFIHGFKAMTHLKGKTLGKIVGDGTQMPGTFVIDTSGTVQFAYISQKASDNPQPSVLLGALSTVIGGTSGNASISQVPISSK